MKLPEQGGYVYMLINGEPVAATGEQQLQQLRELPSGIGLNLKQVKALGSAFKNDGRQKPSGSHSAMLQQQRNNDHGGDWR